jgi:hypothetical protein
MVPLTHLSQLPSSPLTALSLYHNVPKPRGASPELKTYSFGEKEKLDELFSAMETQ